MAMCFASPIAVERRVETRELPALQFIFYDVLTYLSTHLFWGARPLARKEIFQLSPSRQLEDLWKSDTRATRRPPPLLLSAPQALTFLLPTSPRRIRRLAFVHLHHDRTCPPCAAPPPGRGCVRAGGVLCRIPISGGDEDEPNVSGIGSVGSCRGRGHLRRSVRRLPTDRCSENDRHQGHQDRQRVRSRRGGQSASSDQIYGQVYWQQQENGQHQGVRRAVGKWEPCPLSYILSHFALTFVCQTFRWCSRRASSGASPAWRRVSKA